MSSGGHLSRSLASLIRTIGETRSKEQQDDIIKNEIELLKVSLTFNPRDPELFELMIKLLYIETLGHDGSFAHIYPVNLCQSKSPKLKRLAYLLTTLCVNRNSKLSILMLSTIQKDLTGTNLHSLMHCLTALPKIINKTIIQGSLQSLIKLLKHPTDLVRKKTLLVLQKIHQLQPQTLPTYKTFLQQALFDQQPPVVFIAITLLKQLITIDPDPYKQMTDDFCRILKDIVMHKYPKEYDYHRVPAPWMQIEILKVLGKLGNNDPRASGKIYDIVEKTLRKSTYFQMHINNAVVVQAIRTIALLYPNPGLIREAAEYMSRFFERENHNMRCFGIGCLTELVKVDSNVVKHWQMQILECLESEDTTLATAAVELLTNIANDQNTNTIISKLISLAQKQLDKQFQLNLIRKSLILIQRFSSNPTDYIKYMNDLFTKFESIIDNKSLDNYIQILQDAVQSNPEFACNLIKQYSSLFQFTHNLPILKAGCWVLGEMASQVEPLSSVEEIALMLMEKVRKERTSRWVEWAVPAVVKLAQTEGFGRHAEVKEFLLALESCREIRTHNIAEEFIRLAKFGPALKNAKGLNAEKNPGFLADYAAHSQSSKIAKQTNKLPGKQMTESQLKFRPYSLEMPSQRYQPMMGESMIKLDQAASVELFDESILKFNGPKKWTRQGYQGPKPKPVQPKPPSSYIAQTLDKAPGFKPKGPQQKKLQQTLSSQKQDIRKVNLAKSIFTGSFSK